MDQTTDDSDQDRTSVRPQRLKPEPLASQWVWLGLVLAVVVSALVALATAEDSNAGFESSAALLAFVGVVAIAIERLLEMFWNAIGNTRLGGWWPLKGVRDAFDDAEAQANAILRGAFSSTKSTLTAARAKARDAQTLLGQIDDQLAGFDAQQKRLGARLEQARRLAPGSGRLALVTGVARESSDVLRHANSLANQVGDRADDAVDDAIEGFERALDFVSAFEDNPARRIASLALGTSMGLLVAGFMSLNIFSAVLGSGVEADAGLLEGALGILLTGVILGMGANPTHEVIKALQHYKERTRGDDALPLADGAAVGTEPSLAFMNFVESPARQETSGARRHTVRRIRSTR